MPKGVQYNFNYALSMLEDGEWGIFMSDDYTESRRLVDGKFEKCKLSYVLKELERVVNKVDKSGVQLVGMNAVGNPFYARKKYSKYGLIDTRCFAVKKNKFQWDESISTIVDYYATAYHLKHYGGNLIINHCFADFVRYSKKGIGTFDERMEQKIKDCRALVRMFPENVVYRTKPNHPPLSHIVVKR